MHHYIMEGDISDVAICTSLHWLRLHTGYEKTSFCEWKSHIRALNSQRDDSWGEALGDRLGVHTEGTVFGAGAGRRTAGDLGGSPGVRFPRQADTQTQNWQADQPRPSLSELRHPWAGGKRSCESELLEVSPQRWWSASRRTQQLWWGWAQSWERGDGREEGESCVSSVGVGAPQLPRVGAIFPRVSLRSCWQSAHCRDDERAASLRTRTCRQLTMNYLLHTQKFLKQLRGGTPGGGGQKTC